VGSSVGRQEQGTGLEVRPGDLEHHPQHLGLDGWLQGRDDELHDSELETPGSSVLIGDDELTSEVPPLDPS
jgi:hypothetical protein